MAGSEEVIRFQANEHPLVFNDTPVSREEYCLHLMHQKAYEEIKELVRGKVVLDLGCNNGYGTKEVSQHAKETVGVDVSARAIDDARRRYASDGIQFFLFDGVKLPFADEYFDVVTSFQVIEHVVDVGAYLAEIFRVMKPQGIAIFTTPNAAIRLDPGMKPWNEFHVREYRGAELASVLRSRFSEVTIHGLFAAESFYAIEYDRCQKARRIARWKAGDGAWPRSLRGCEEALAGIALRVLPKFAIAALRKLPRRVAPGARIDRPLAAEFSTSDLFYRQDNLEGALDLMAICLKSGSAHFSRTKSE